MMKKFLQLFIIFSILNFSNNILSQDIKFEHISHEGTPYFGTINSIIQDKFGFLWLGTSNGLFRHDGYNFKAFKHNPDDSNSISGNHIWSVCEDKNGDLWIGTSGRGLNKYIRNENRFNRFSHNPEDSTSLAGGDEVPWIIEDSRGNILAALWEKGLDIYDSRKKIFFHNELTIRDEEGTPRSSVHRIYEDKFGDLWIGTKRGVFRRKTGEKKFTLYRHDPSNKKSIIGNYIFSILEDRKGRLWFGTYDGLSKYDRQKNEFINYTHNPKDVNSLSSDLVTSMCVDSSGFIWVGTDDQGLNRFDPASEKFTRYKSIPGSSLISNRITSLVTDKSGVLWIGTIASGLIKYSPGKIKFIHHQIIEIPFGKPENPGSLIVDAILESGDGSIWIGTGGEGLYKYDPVKKKYSVFKNNSKDLNTISSNSITALCEDRKGNLWIGTGSKGLNYFSIKENKFSRFQHNPADPKSLQSNRINCLLIDTKGNLWIGTDGKSISIYDTKNKRFENYWDNPNPPVAGAIHTFDIFEDSHNNIWLGAWGEGVFKYNLSSENLSLLENSVTRFQHDPNDPSTISGDHIISIEEDIHGNMWLGIWGGGVNKLEKRTNKIKHYSSADGLPNDIVYGILSDGNGNIWVSTGNGLAEYNQKKNKWISYDIHDGLQSMEFRRGSSHKGRSGKFYFGGINGFNEFNPEMCHINEDIPNIVLTSFKISGKELIPGFNGSLELLNELTLSYNQNNISFEFAALEFTHPKKNKYAYMLEGFDDDWIYNENSRIATYTNLDPGEYILKLKGSNNDGVWNNEGTSIGLTITTPPWKTWWAYTFYGLTFMIMLYAARKYELNRIQLKNQLKIEHMESEKLKELDQLKSKFFANISHEFRTPLTLILGPVEDAISKIQTDSIKSQLKTAYTNGKKLLRLINQLLDLSKIEAGKMKLKTGKQNIISFLKGIVYTFDSLAKQRKITLQFQSEFSNVEIYIDAEKLEQVFYNLMSNALKFTQEDLDGKVVVSIERIKYKGLGKFTSIAEFVQISIKDNGIGIPESELPYIFNRFYRANDSTIRGYEGTGIGLALTKEIVELHYGEIIALSEAGKGTEFIVKMPLGKDHLKESEIVEKDFGVSVEEDFFYTEQIEEKQSFDLHEDNNEIILIVEDNEEVRKFICQNLKSNYKIIEAVEGEEGFGKAANIIPDLIISDVMMPKLDGNELSRRIKNDERTSHIPIILLTAKGGEDSKLEGLETGADDYLTKPFSSKELLVRIKNLIGQRKKLREKFSREEFFKPGKISVSSVDFQFLNKVKEVIEENIGDENFTVESLASEVALSRVQLHRKLKALTNQSASEFILGLRLQRAADLIKQNAASISEIAYMTGFNTPNYFAKCFRKQFGCSPTEFKIKIS